MKLLEKLKLTPEEKKLIKQVFIVSLSISVLTVVIVWGIQRISLKTASTEKMEENSEETDIIELYRAKSDDLLPIDIEAHKMAAEKYKETTPIKSIKHLLRILSVERKNRKVMLDLATAYLKSGIYDKAKDMFEKLIEAGISDSLMPQIMSRYGLTLFFLDRIDESMTYLEKTVTDFPGSAEAFCYLGQVKAAQNLASPEAEEYLRKAVDINPRYSEGWYQLARYYMKKPGADSSDYLHARKCLLRQLAIEPLNPKGHSRLGMVYFYLHQPYLADKSYQTALALNEYDYNTHYNLGELYFTSFNDSKKALEEFKQAVRIKPDHVEANFKIGLISLENNMFKEAVQYFTKALERSPKNIRILLQLGISYEKLSMTSEALNVYHRILSYDALNDVALQKIKLLSSGKR